MNHRPHRVGTLCGAAIALGLAGPALAQGVSQKGFVELRGTGYADEAANDTTRAVGELLVRYEASARLASWLGVDGSVDLRAASHGQTADTWRVDWDDRGERRPHLAVRTLRASITHGAVTVDLGKQFIRWGKADLLNPTDRFAPQDFLTVVTHDPLAVTGGRAQVGLQSDTLDLVAARFTPSRLPLANQRWAAVGALRWDTLPDRATIIDRGRTLPDEPQFGARWNHVGRGFECSLSGYRGFQHTPALEWLPTIAIYPPVLAFSQAYPRIWTVGGDAVIPMRQVSLKAEAAYVASRDHTVDEYWIYVVQLERQAGEWFFVGGYAGEVVTTDRETPSFLPERGLTNAFLGRAGYTIDTNRSVSVEGAVRRTGDGSWLRADYSQAIGAHLRLSLQGNWIRGGDDDYFGRYRRNSNVMATLRASF